MKTVVELKNVSKVIRGRKIIDDLSFEVNEGEVFGFLGPNGAGKTTTIRMIVGLIRITSGDIAICGKNVVNDYEDAIQNVGAIVENPELYKFLTGYQNLQQVARVIKGITNEKINEIVEFVGLKDRIHDKVKTYSLGMRQRLGIAQSLLHDPKILILDEPTNGLDPAGIREMRDYLRNLAAEKGLAIIVSSHLLSEMEMMCDRIAIIQKGKLINVQDVRSNENKAHQDYVCHVNDPKKALKLLVGKGYKVKEHKDGLEIEMEKDQVPNMVAILVENQILIYEVRRISKSLEDRFLEITNNKEVAAHA
ncbi:ABC transporter ATP-binding protein [Lederbergia lenta]|uniref:Putative ABC transporter ATP-binding protein n=1 Tax=Lederbergia lenta TaxID=1467 RepID=A0A2X4VPJ5_LEDLE|nr:ABC transporter ATP-binding protein [Lederbergia lenta]MCM3110945.1 ABC transporter ATP-binding protein [Lederbergia lenta]MEC2325659.1 ABC transporter ATP-binding protein [Lederbergia lenta]SQI54036.1 putative ABC transporter ATP-binding protein [Lederbergia lenta]